MAEQSQKFDMPSGALLVVTVAPFADAWALMRASLKTLKGLGLKQEDLKGDMGSILESPSMFTLIMDRIVDFATSPDVEAAVWKCATRALYVPAGSDPAFPGMRVGPQLFDDPEHGTRAREDYARIVAGILEVNCKPFLAKALSGLLRPKASSADGQLSK